MTLQIRIKQARERAGLKQRELAEKAHVATSTIGNLEAGRRNTCREIVAVAKALNVRPEWLARGDGNMEIDKPTIATESEKIHVALVTQEEINLLTQYRSSTVDGKNFINYACDVAEKRKILLPVSEYKP